MWENSKSKLHYIKPQIEKWESTHNSCRQFEVKLNRLRIRHTRLTKSHLMTKGDEHPTYIGAACGH